MYHLELGGQLHQVHPVFHGSLLRPFHTGGNGHPMPIPLELDEGEVFEVGLFVETSPFPRGHL